MVGYAATLERDAQPDAAPSEDAGAGTIRVLIAEDDPLARRMLCEQLDCEDVTLVGQARDGEEAVAMALELRPDVAVVDLTMPRCDGITAAARIAQREPDIRIVILSAAGDDQEAGLLALRAGAIGFLDKEIDPGALLRVVRGVERGEAAVNRIMTRRLISEFRIMCAKAEAKSATRTQAACSDLSDRELQVLRLLAQGLSTGAMSEELGLTVETVRTHVKSVLRKLRVHSRQEAIELFRRRQPAGLDA
jgi:DNA-binding NarL/FixJ family response regulator